jgi:hypothetical protein
MNVVKFNNFTEFYKAFQPEFSRTGNKRLLSLFRIVASLHKGCGCTRRKRTEFCSKEYRSMSQVLQPENIQLMKMKHPMTKFEFLEGKELFHVIQV